MKFLKLQVIILFSVILITICPNCLKFLDCSKGGKTPVLCSGYCYGLNI